jgi:hypothetical protein
VREQSATRRELEAALRRLLPTHASAPEGASQNPLVAGAGVGGLLGGYVWGWVRGRRSRSKRSRS